MSVALDYNINAQAKPRAVNARVLEIGGQAIDCSVNANNWQVPPEELDYFIANSQNVQIRVNHSDHVEDVKGAVNFLRAGTDGLSVEFCGEVCGDEELLSKIERQYVNCVSPKVTGDFECSSCHNPSRDSQLRLAHICRGAWEIVRKPRMVELSIVAKGAYEACKFKPMGFAAAVNCNQKSALAEGLAAADKARCTVCASAPTLVCLSCTGKHPSQVRQGGDSNVAAAVNPETHVEGNQMSANPQTALTMEVVEAKINEHAAKMAEACKSQIAASAEAQKLEFQAMIAKATDSLKAAAGARSQGKGIAGTLNENTTTAKKLSPGVVAVQPYFKELLEAAEKNKALHGAASNQGVS